MTVSLAHQGLKDIPEEFLAEKRSFKNKVEVLDLSYNQLTNLLKLDGYDNIHTLILDSNNFNSHSILPKMLSITYISLVDNEIANLSIFIDKLAVKFPNLKYLNLLKNPAAPNYFNNGSVDEYEDYRLYVINSMPSLKVVDYISVTEEEVKESKRVYGNLPSAKSGKDIPRGPSVLSSKSSPQKENNDIKDIPRGASVLSSKSSPQKENNDIKDIPRGASVLSSKSSPQKENNDIKDIPRGASVLSSKSSPQKENNDIKDIPRGASVLSSKSSPQRGNNDIKDIPRGASVLSSKSSPQKENNDIKDIPRGASVLSSKSSPQKENNDIKDIPRGASVLSSKSSPQKENNDIKDIPRGASVLSSKSSPQSTERK